MFTSAKKVQYLPRQPKFIYWTNQRKLFPHFAKTCPSGTSTQSFWIPSSGASRKELSTNLGPPRLEEVATFPWLPLPAGATAPPFPSFGIFFCHFGSGPLRALGVVHVPFQETLRTAADAHFLGSSTTQRSEQIEPKVFFFHTSCCQIPFPRSCS